MCGIAGCLGRSPVADDRAEACLKAMRHRGPDGCGTYRHERSGNHVLLLHARLAIIDIDERAGQPMRHDGRVISFNGELYNYLELRAGLERWGEAFATSSDTEVLLRLLAHGGEAALDGMEGMWAFALYDERQGALTLCRDRFGEKPLFIHQAGDGLYFASEVKALFALMGKRLPVNRQKLLRYVVNGYRFIYKTPDTFFEGVDELPSAGVMRIGTDLRSTSKAYWRPLTAINELMTYDEAVSGVRERLFRAVEIRLRSDVPLAFCMSGGVDSNALISIARRVFNHEVHGFTIINADERYNEWEPVQDTIRELSLRHTVIRARQEGFLERLSQMVRQHDAPVCTISYYVHQLLMESIAAQGYKVSVSGTAADELFTGYYDHHLMYLAAVYGTPLFEPSLANWQEYVRPMVRNPLLQDPLIFIKSPGMREHLCLDAKRAEDQMVHPFFEPFAEEKWHPELLRNRMLNEMFREVVPAALREDDHNAMAVSVENRSPFLDRALFDFCSTIPTRHLIRNGYSKSILRDAVRGIAPDGIVNSRKKVGFNGSLFEYLDVESEDVRKTLLADSPIFDIIDRSAFARLLRPGKLSNDASKFLFGVLSCKFFLEEFATNV